MKKRILATCIFALSLTMSAYSFDNPVAEFYPNGYPSWTDNINWSNVINMQTDSRITSIEGQWARYEKGVELLGEAGGVLYYPAGKYVFSDIPDGDNGAKEDGEGIMLRSGVILMGEKPAKFQMASEVDGGKIELGTIFEFPLYDRQLIGANDEEIVRQTPGHWNFVGIKPRKEEELKDVNNVGVCFINFKYGGIYWGAQYTWAESYQDPNRQSYGAAGCDAHNGWMPNRVADGTHYADPFSGCKKVTMVDNVTGNSEDGTEYLGAGSGRLVLACRLDDAVLMDAGGYNGEFKDGEAAGEARNYRGLALDAYRFAARITIDASNVFIGATSITKPTNAFIYKEVLQMPSKDPISGRDNRSMMLRVPQLFDPAKHIGIDIGKGILGIVNKAQRHMLDDKAPFYEPNIVVRDCYVYNHGHKGYEISGRWVKILNNVNDRDFLDAGSIPEPESPENISHVGDAKKVYGLTDKISYKIRKGNSTVDVAGAEGHYIARISSLRGTNQTDDNMSRAFDMGGHNVWIDGNRYWGTGSWPGNDGEGILGQRSGEIEAFSWATTNNEAVLKSDPWPRSGYMATWNMHIVGGLWYHNKGGHPEWLAGVWATGGDDKVEEVSIINNYNTNKNDLSEKLDETSVSTKGVNWTTSSAPTTGVKAPSGVKVELNQEEGYVEISWNPDYVIENGAVTDNSNEVGYRVERRKVGSNEWSAIAYRPMQNGHKHLTGVNRTYKGKNSWTLEEMDLNPAMWRDYEKINGVAEYRVVALGVDENSCVPQTEEPIKVDFTAGVQLPVTTSVKMLYNTYTQEVQLSEVATTIKVVNMAGAVVANGGHTDSLSVATLPAGVYVVIADVNGECATLKIVKHNNNI